MCEFQYSCRCETRSCIKISRSIDREHKQKLADAIRQLAERAWDDDDQGALPLLAKVIQRPKTSHLDMQTAETTLERLYSYDEQCALPLVKRNSSSVTYSCICTEVRQTVSILVSSCLTRLHSRHRPSEDELLHTVAAIKPFVTHFQHAAVVKSFFRELWHLSLQHSMNKLKDELSVVYPQFIHSLLDELLVVYAQEPKMLHAETNYVKLFTCMTTAAGFFGATVCYLSERDYLAHRMLQVIVTEIRSRTTSKAFLQLFPSELRQYVAIMNAVIDTKDPEIEQLLHSLQSDDPQSFNALITCFPMFRHLRNKSATFQ